MLANSFDKFQSTLPARGATLYRRLKTETLAISIHAPRTGSDTHSSSAVASRRHFNPRSPHGERPGACRFTSHHRDFNPRSPHGERRVDLQKISTGKMISIHAPRTGSDDLPLITLYIHFAYFNPRSPHGERPASAAAIYASDDFNPRSPHGERPKALPELRKQVRDFNPRSPHGERRHDALRKFALPVNFNPRSPHGERLFRFRRERRRRVISIHAPRTGSDVWE